MRRAVSSRGRRFEDTRLPSEPRLGAQLLGFAAEWHRVTTDSFVRAVVRDGYRVELVALPPLSRSNSHAVISGLREGAVSSKRDNLLVEQGSGRGNRHGDALSRVLQSDLLGAQERRHIQASIRREVPERLRSQGEVQNDYSQGSDTRVAQGGLGGKCRFERRLLPRPHTQEVTPNTAICRRRFRRGQGLSVPRPTVRTNVRATGIHKGDITYRTLGTRARRLSPTISRRLDIGNTDKSLLHQQAKWLLGVLRCVGLVLNAQKSKLVPTQRLIHIGVEYHLDVGLIFPPMDRVLRIEQKVSFLLFAQVTTAYFCSPCLGL